MPFFNDKLRKPEIIRLTPEKEIGAGLVTFKNQTSYWNYKTRL